MGAGGQAQAGASADGELDFAALGRALWRRRLWVLGPAALAALLAVTAVNLVTPRYRSEARLIIDGRENVFLRPEAERGAERDRALLDQEAITSQVQLALSREVARAVIEQLQLSEQPEFDPALAGPGRLRPLLSLLGLARDPLRQRPEERVFENYYARVQAFQVDKSRVIALAFQSADPELAARGANALAAAYLTVLQAVRQQQTKAAGQFLAGEIETLRARVAEAEQKVEAFRVRSNLFVGAGGSLATQQLGELTTQLGAARAQAAEAAAKARAIRDMLRASRPVEAGEIINSELIRRLNEQRVTLRGQLAEQSATLLDAHPRIKELRAQIADLERQIRAEAERQVRALESDAEIAAARVEELGARLEQLKRQAAASNEQDVPLRALEREAKAQRDLLESYLAKYRETLARENLASPAEARIISPAIVSHTPAFPQKLPIVLIATLATLVLGIGFVTTGELLAGQVYRPAGEFEGRGEGVGVGTGPGAGIGTAPADSAAARAPTPDARPDPAAPHGLAALAATLAARGRSRSAVLAPDGDTAALARALGRALAGTARAVVVDLDLGAPTGGPAGLADLVRGQAAFAAIITRDPGSRAHRVAAGDPAGDPAAILAAERLTIALDALARTYEHLVINLGPLDRLADLGAAGRLARLAPTVVLAADPAHRDAAHHTLATAGCHDILPLDPAREASDAQPGATAAEAA